MTILGLSLRRKLLFSVIGATLVTVAIALGLVYLLRGSDPLDEYLSVGDEDMESKEYDRAISSYTEAASTSERITL